MSGAAERGGRIAAFFDVDGTLLPGPSLELRFFAALRSRKAIPARNYFLWAMHAVRLAPRGIAMVAHANKMYLCGVPVESGRARSTDTLDCPGVNQTENNSAMASSVQPLSFFPAAMKQLAWHASAGHAIVLMTGTLAPLAHEVATALTLRLAARGLPASIGVCATRLEESQGRWTGRILGEAMFGEAKAHAVRQIAASQDFDLSRCYAYGDSTNDRWFLAAVGRPAAVNPSPDLGRTARLHDWPVLLWKEEAAPDRRDPHAECAGVEAKTEILG
jgi:HAD superfamily hydrolase (TIGR01490 family)